MNLTKHVKLWQRTQAAFNNRKVHRHGGVRFGTYRIINTNAAVSNAYTCRYITLKTIGNNTTILIKCV
jgi:hypothetical protein